MAGVKTSVDYAEIITGKNRYYHKPFVAPLGERGFAVLFHDAPARDPIVLIDPRGTLAIMTCKEPFQMDAKSRRTVPRVSCCGTAPALVPLSPDRFLITDNVWHTYNWMGEPYVRVASGHEWVVSLRGATSMIVDASEDRLRFGKPRFIRCLSYPALNGYDRPVVRDDGVILFCADFDTDASQKEDNPWETVLTRSGDQGETWEHFGTIYSEKEQEKLPRLQQPSMAEAGGELVCALASTPPTSSFYFSRSTDGGRKWDTPGDLEINGYSHSLMALSDGRLLLAFSPFEEPFGVVARISEDNGRTWPENNSIVIEDRSKNPDCGSVRGLQLDDGSLCFVYSCSLTRNARSIIGARLEL